VAVPELTARVNDLAGMLSPVRRDALEQRLAAYEQETAHQLVVLTIESLEGEAIEAYSMRVVERWELGQEKFDNGLLLLVARADRRVRIEVGYGLEGVVPDAVAARIIRERIVPRFRAGDMEGGIESGVDALMAAGRGEVFEVPRAPSSQPGGGPLMMVLMISVACGALFGGAFRRTARPVGSLLAGGTAGFVSFLLLSSLGWGLAAFALGAAFGFIGPMGGVGYPGGLGRHRGGYGGGGFGGGGFGGGGFGGGGGGFGGGGASGSW
jgi:uncharacterized protein